MTSVPPSFDSAIQHVLRSRMYSSPRSARDLPGAVCITVSPRRKLRQVRHHQFADGRTNAPSRQEPCDRRRRHRAEPQRCPRRPAATATAECARAQPRGCPFTNAICVAVDSASCVFVVSCTSMCSPVICPLMQQRGFSCPRGLVTATLLLVSRHLCLWGAKRPGAVDVFSRSCCARRLREHLNLRLQFQYSLNASEVQTFRCQVPDFAKSDDKVASNTDDYVPARSGDTNPSCSYTAAAFCG